MVSASVEDIVEISMVGRMGPHRVQGAARVFTPWPHTVKAMREAGARHLPHDHSRELSAPSSGVAERTSVVVTRIYPDGTRFHVWHHPQTGAPHRVDGGPAEVHAYPDGKGDAVWECHGVTHRADGPAYGDGHGFIDWTLNGNKVTSLMSFPPRRYR